MQPRVILDNPLMQTPRFGHMLCVQRDCLGCTESLKHHGAVLPPLFVPEGCGADGVVAMAAIVWLEWVT
jgi:hypothetical protein